MSMNLPPPPPGTRPDGSTPPPVPPGWRPPPPDWPPAEDREAPPPEWGSPVVTSTGSGAKRAILLVIALAVAGVLGAIGFVALGGGDDESATPPVTTSPEVSANPPDTTAPVTAAPEVTATPPVATEAPPVTAPPPETTAAPAAPPVVDLFAGTQAEEVVRQIAAARGADPIRLLELVLYPDYAFAQAQDPAIPEYVDRFGWRNGAVSAPEPVRLVGSGDLEANLFSSDEVAWPAVPAVVAAAVEQAGIRDGSVTHVIVARDLPWKPDIVFRVYVSSARESGYVEFDAQGGFLEVVR